MSKKGKEHSSVKQFSLNGHTRPVNMVKYNKDGDMFFTCSNDFLIIAWDTVNAEKRGVYKGKSACKSLAVTKDTEYVIGSYGLEGVTIYEAITGNEVHSFKANDGYRHQYLELSYGDDELLVLSIKKDVSAIDIYDFKKLLKGNAKPKRSFEFDVELSQVSYGYLNEQLYLSTNNGKILIINAQTGEVENEAKVHPGHQIFSFAFSKDFSMLASCAKDNKCKLLHPETLEVVKIFDKESPCRCAAFSPLYDLDDEDRYHLLIAGGQDAKDVTTTKAKEGSFETRLFHLIYEEELAQITGHFGPVHSISWAPDGRGFVTASEDGTVRLQRFPLEFYEK